MELYCPDCGFEDFNESRYCMMCGALRSPDVPEPFGLEEGTGKLPPLLLLMERYEIQRPIGHGGMAAVYEAIDLRTNRRAAIKELSTADIAEPSEREEAVNQFYQEAQLLANLSHPNLPRVTDFFNAFGKYYLVMDFVEGDSLQRILQKSSGPISEAQVIAWAIQVCDVLTYLHTNIPPIVFRDLKPSNIMIEQAGQIRLIDFGIARLFKPGQAQDTTALGTIGYAPPEQFGSSQSDPRSDIYAFGVTLYELLTKCDPTSRPFGLPPIRESNPRIPATLADIITRSIEFDAAKRWQTVAELAAALIAYQRGTPEHKSRTGRLRVSVLLTPQRIPLSCTLNEAKEKVFVAKRHMAINQLANSVLESNPFECKFIALVGYRGVGTSEICRRAKEIVIGRQTGVIVHVNTSLPTQVDEVAQFWEEVLAAMKLGDRGLDWRVKHAIESTYRKYMSDKSIGTLTEFRFASPVTIKFNIGPVSISIGDTPIEFKRAVEQKTLTEEQSIQQQRERLYKAIRELVSYLIQNDVRVTLFFDNVIDTHTLQLLRPFGAIGGLSTIFVTDPENYEAWSQEHKDLIKKTIYVECLWSMAREVCNHMVNKNGREVRTNEYQFFLKSLEFQGRGLPRHLMAELEKYYDDPTNEAGLKRRLGLTNPALVINEERLMAIRMFGELQEILDHGWQSLFVDERGVSLILQKDWSHDQARLGVYKVLGWMIDQANNGQLFSKTKLYKTIVSNTHLTPKKGEQLGRNLIKLLQQAGKVEVSARGIDATGILPTVHLV